jgi:hypothetical protein
MQVVAKLEDAAYARQSDSSCRPNGDCNSNQVQEWDTAVALYTGSIPELPAGDGDDGLLLYKIAERFCDTFGTCVKTGDDAGISAVNQEIFDQFREGQENLLLGKYWDLQRNVQRIILLLTVPLIQGTLRYVYRMDKLSDSSDKTRAKARTFAASVLPLCCTGADTLYDSVREANYTMVKSTLEENYECMGITPEMVGAISDLSSQGFLDDVAEPCGLFGCSDNSDSSDRLSLIKQYLINQEISSKEDLEKVGSPQQKALEWIAMHDGLSLDVPVTDKPSKEGYNFTTRFILSLLYFSTNQDESNWTLSANFLAASSHCQWYMVLHYTDLSTEFLGVACDEKTGEVIGLFLSKFRGCGLYKKDIVLSIRSQSCPRRRRGLPKTQYVCSYTASFLKSATGYDSHDMNL